MTKQRRKSKPRTYEGLPVVDAIRPINLEINKLDVAHAKKSDPANCAAALAGKRILHKEVRVFLTRTYVKEKKHWVRYITPQSVSREIISFDRGAAFEPGEYKMDRPSPGQKLGIKRGKSTHASKSNNRKGPYHATVNVRPFDKTQIGKK